MRCIYGTNRAVPALIAGMAFFLMSCKAVLPPRPLPEKKLPVGAFARAEEYVKRGDLDKALDNYFQYLSEEPQGEKVPIALHRIGDIYSKTERHEEALNIFSKLLREHPYYIDRSNVQFQIATQLYLLGRYKAATQGALEWLRTYPSSPLKGDVMALLGDCAEAAGDVTGAFRWWLGAEQEGTEEPRTGMELGGKIRRLILGGNLKELEEISTYAARSPYASDVYYRMARLFMAEDRLEKAREAAMSLAGTAREDYWKSAADLLLTRIREEMSIRRGVLGCLLPLSGPFALFGEEALNGIQLGMDIFGGPGKGPVRELVIMDTQGQPEIAASAVEELADREKVVGIIGPLSSKTASAVAEKAQEMGVPVIALTQKEGITKGRGMVFRNFLTPTRQVDRILQAAVDEMGLRRFGILYPDNPYGRFYMSLFWRELNKKGGVVTAVESYDPDKTDFADEIRKMTGLYYPRPPSLVVRLRAERPMEEEENELTPKEPAPIVDFDAVFIPDTYQRVAMIAPQLVYHDVLDVQLLGTSLWQSQKLIELAGEYVQGAIFPSGFYGDYDDPALKAFVESYRANFESEPGILAATAYDTMRFLQKVMAQRQVRTRKDLREAILWSDGFHGVTGKIFFDIDGEVERKPILLTVRGRRMRLYR